MPSRDRTGRTRSRATTRSRSASRRPSSQPTSRPTPRRRTRSRPRARTRTQSGRRTLGVHALRTQARRRTLALLVLVILAFGGITARLVQIQGFSAEHLSALGSDQRVRTVELSAERGTIFDRNGVDLALSVPQETVFADPRLIRDPVGDAAALAPVLGIEAAELERRLSAPDTAFTYLARQVDAAVADDVRALAIPGIDFVPESKRHYPAGGLAAPVLGFTGIDNEGLGGLEADYDELLAGKPGELVVEEDPDGREIPSAERRYRPAERGSDLILTIDESLQHEVEEALLDQVAATNANGGTAIIADVKTGDILAMAIIDSGPEGATRAASSSMNRAFTDVFEPGSTNKVITIGAALEEGMVTPDTTYSVGPQIGVGDGVFEEHDWHPVSAWSVADILRESSNVGTIQIALELGKDRLDHYLREFGLGSSTSVGFPGEAPGIVPTPDEYSGTSIATVPMGHGLAVTPMQMLNVYTTIANDGVARDARLVGATVDGGGTRQNLPIDTGTRVVSESTAASLTSMMTDVVTAGTGKLAAIDGYTVAGKTGTAQQVAEGGTGYVEGAFDASFAGFAPVDDPRLAAIVVLDRPQPYYGGTVAAPVFSDIMRMALRTLSIPTSGSEQYRQASEAAAAQESREAAEIDAAADAAAAQQAVPATAPVSEPAGEVGADPSGVGASPTDASAYGG